MMMDLPMLRERLLPEARRLAPGIGVAALVAAAASFLAEHYGAPVMLFALLIGMAFHFLAENARCGPGVAFASKTLLRLGVALLGFRITFGQIAALGIEAILAVIFLVAVTIATGFIAARLFGRGWRFALLTGGSVAICGASAALAIAAVIPHNEKTERNILFTVVAVTTLSTIAMVLYPILFAALGLDDVTAGFLVGATIHDVAQVVGAGYSISEAAGETATIVKLLRVAMLPIILLIVVVALRSQATAEARPGLPWFVTVFAALVALNSLLPIPEIIGEAANSGSKLLLITAIAALGMKTDLRAFTELGSGHVWTVVLETLAMLAMALLLAMTLLEIGAS